MNRRASSDLWGRSVALFPFCGLWLRCDDASSVVVADLRHDLLRR